jgi:hypothetical protein
MFILTNYTFRPYFWVIFIRYLRLNVSPLNCHAIQSNET